MNTSVTMPHKSAFFLGIVALMLDSALAQPASAQPAPAAIPKAAADPVRGGKLYEARCGGCHSLDSNRIGPMHRGVVGRPAGSIATYSYSTALKRSKLIWTPANLDRWLMGPTRLVPGTRMAAFVAVPADRSDIIAYLASASISTKK